MKGYGKMENDQKVIAMNHGAHVGKELLHEIAENPDVKSFAVVAIKENGNVHVSWGGRMTNMELAYAVKALDMHVTKSFEALSKT